LDYHSILLDYHSILLDYHSILLDYRVRYNRCLSLLFRNTMAVYFIEGKTTHL
jgi:hypothetical protein